jgi:integral membrane sensor domain MASE1
MVSVQGGVALLVAALVGAFFCEGWLRIVCQFYVYTYFLASIVAVALYGVGPDMLLPSILGVVALYFIEVSRAARKW